MTEKYKRIEFLYDEPDLTSGAIANRPEGYTITFDNVTFAYKDKDVFRNMSFETHEGSVTVIVGESGAGKSTVAKLIARFWDVSGGQRQRITIARAILKNAPVVILNEATSNTDAENEDLIQEALSELLVGKTVIVIAHRLSTITGADNIIVLKQGEVAAQGKHNALLQLSEDYRRMWNRYAASSCWEYQTKGGKTLSC